MIKQIGFAYQSAASAAEIHRNLCNGMNNAQPESVSSVPSVVKTLANIILAVKNADFHHFFITFSSLFYRFSITFRSFSVNFSLLSHISTTSTTFLPLFLPLLNRLLIRYLSAKVVEVVDFFQKNIGGG